MLKNLKKYIPKRKYRERSQLESRKKLGLLEKKQDYKIRSDNYHEKEARYKKLKELARTNNPEEFYFGMANSKILDNEHVNFNDGSTIGKRLANTDKLRNLVNYKKSVQVKEREKLISNLNMYDTGETKESIHTIFVDNAEEAANFKPEEYFETNSQLIKNTSNRLKNSQISEMKVCFNILNLNCRFR